MPGGAGDSPSPSRRRAPCRWRMAPVPGVVAISLLGCLPGARTCGFLAEAARVRRPAARLCLSAMNCQSRLLARLRLGAACRLRRATLRRRRCGERGFLLEEQIFDGHFLAAGRLVLLAPRDRSTPGARRRPGSRDPWAARSSSSARRAA